MTLAMLAKVRCLGNATASKNPPTWAAPHVARASSVALRVRKRAKL